MTNLQAALGIAQLERLNEFVEKKRRMGKLYTEFLSDIKGIELPVALTEYAENIYWVYGIVLKDEFPDDADKVMKTLREKEIGTRPFFWPMHQQPVFAKKGLFLGESYPEAERIARKGFYIPSGLALTDHQIKKVAKVLHQVIQ
jgi:perosamine synthetase